MVACAGMAYFTLQVIISFTDFCIEEYTKGREYSSFKDKVRIHQEFRLPGGICEMTLLYLWLQHVGDLIQFRNLLLPYHDTICDYGMRETNIYRDGEV